MSDPLGPKPSLEPALVADAEWGADAVAEVENQSWQHDPDLADAQAAAPQEDEVQPETTQSEEQSPEEPQAEPAPDEIPVDASPRAQDRIRETIAERNAERERANQLQAMLEKLVQSQTRTTALQEQQYAAQAARQQAENAKQGEAAILAKFKAYGLNEHSVSDWLAFESITKAEVAERKLAAYEEAEAQRQQEARVTQYETVLKRELETAGKRFKISDEDIVDLYDQAYSLARAKQIANPAEAVARVLKPYVKLAKPAPVATKRPDPNDPTHNAISARGRAAERRPGEKPSGRPNKIRDVEDIEREMGAGRFD